MLSCSLLRRGTAWAMISLYGLVVSGLPVAMPPEGAAAAKTLAQKDRSRPFPCMDKACGCASAEQCFTNCCCHTPAETLAWAKARGIETAVIDALSRRVATAPVEPPVASCCSAADEADAEPSSCCATDIDDRDEAICSDYQSLAAETKPRCRDEVSEQSGDDDAPIGVPPTPRVVVLRAMLACGGIVAQWASFGTSLPPPEIVTCEMPWPQVGVLAVDDERLLGAGSPPELPPPRCS